MFKLFYWRYQSRYVRSFATQEAAVRYAEFGIDHNEHAVEALIHPNGTRWGYKQISDEAERIAAREEAARKQDKKEHPRPAPTQMMLDGVAWEVSDE